MSKYFKPHRLKGDASEKALAREAERAIGRKIKKLGLLINSRLYPRCLLDHADSLSGLEGDRLRGRLRKLSPNGEPYEFVGYTYVYDDESKNWQKKCFEYSDFTHFQNTGLKFPLPPTFEQQAATELRVSSPDPEVQAAGKAECSCLMAEMEPADRAKKKDEAFSNMPAEEHSAQLNVSLRLRHEDQAPRN
jgi:hypothetical protein